MRTKAEYERAAVAQRAHTVLGHERRLLRLLQSRGHCVSLDHETHTMTLGDRKLLVKVGAGHVTVNGVTYPFRKRRSHEGDYLLSAFVCGFFGLQPPPRVPKKAPTLREQIKGRIRGVQRNRGEDLYGDIYSQGQLDAYREVLALMDKRNT